MSGGVDSASAALMLAEAGHAVQGLTMRLPVFAGGVWGTSSADDAIAICQRFGLPHRVVDVAEDFQAAVIAPFRAAYAAGRTPCPCVWCNAAVKFGLLARIARDALGADRLATGHYAQVERLDGRTFLARAARKAKDQSYFLYRMPPEVLERLDLPLGGLAKAEVRAYAAGRGLVVPEQAESMDLCFAAEGSYHALLDASADEPGEVVDTAGRVLGRHDGVRHVTVGQRKGLGIAAAEPLYVLRLLPAEHRVVLGPRAEAMRCRVRVREPHWLQPDRATVGSVLRGKVRSTGEPQVCRVTEVSDADFAVEFGKPVFAPAPGQHLVLYDGDERLAGGGEIQ